MHGFWLGACVTLLSISMEFQNGWLVGRVLLVITEISSNVWMHAWYSTQSLRILFAHVLLVPPLPCVQTPMSNASTSMGKYTCVCFNNCITLLCWTKYVILFIFSYCIFNNCFVNCPEPPPLTTEPNTETLTETPLPTTVPLTETPQPTTETPTETPPPTTETPTETPSPTTEPPTETPSPTTEPPTETPSPTTEPPTETLPPTTETPTETPSPTTVPPTETQSPTAETPTVIAPPPGGILTPEDLIALTNALDSFISNSKNLQSNEVGYSHSLHLQNAD